MLLNTVSKDIRVFVHIYFYLKFSRTRSAVDKTAKEKSYKGDDIDIVCCLNKGPEISFARVHHQGPCSSTLKVKILFYLICVKLIRLISLPFLLALIQSVGFFYDLLEYVVLCYPPINPLIFI